MDIDTLFTKRQPWATGFGNNIAHILGSTLKDQVADRSTLFVFEAGFILPILDIHMSFETTYPTKKLTVYATESEIAIVSKFLEEGTAISRCVYSDYSTRYFKISASQIFLTDDFSKADQGIVYFGQESIDNLVETMKSVSPTHVLFCHVGLHIDLLKRLYASLSCPSVEFIIMSDSELSILNLHHEIIDIRRVPAFHFDANYYTGSLKGSKDTKNLVKSSEQRFLSFAKSAFSSDFVAALGSYTADAVLQQPDKFFGVTEEKNGFPKREWKCEIVQRMYSEKSTVVTKMPTEKDVVLVLTNLLKFCYSGGRQPVSSLYSLSPSGTEVTFVNPMNMAHTFTVTTDFIQQNFLKTTNYCLKTVTTGEFKRYADLPSLCHYLRTQCVSANLVDTWRKLTNTGLASFFTSIIDEDESDQDDEDDGKKKAKGKKTNVASKLTSGAESQTKKRKPTSSTKKSRLPVSKVDLVEVVDDTSDPYFQCYDKCKCQESCDCFYKSSIKFKHGDAVAEIFMRLKCAHGYYR